MTASYDYSWSVPAKYIYNGNDKTLRQMNNFEYDLVHVHLVTSKNVAALRI